MCRFAARLVPLLNSLPTDDRASHPVRHEKPGPPALAPSLRDIMQSEVFVSGAVARPSLGQTANLKAWRAASNRHAGPLFLTRAFVNPAIARVSLPHGTANR